MTMYNLRPAFIMMFSVALLVVAVAAGMMVPSRWSQPSVAQAAPVELIALKDGTTFAARVTMEGGGTLRVDRALAIQIKQPEKDAPADAKAQLSYVQLTQGELKLTGELKIPEANINFREVLSQESPLYAAVMK